MRSILIPCKGQRSTFHVGICIVRVPARVQIRGNLRKASKLINYHHTVGLHQQNGQFESSGILC